MQDLMCVNLEVQRSLHDLMCANLDVQRTIFIQDLMCTNLEVQRSLHDLMCANLKVQRTVFTISRMVISMYSRYSALSSRSRECLLIRFPISAFHLCTVFKKS